jgi:MoxR-like ATPase
MLDALTPESEYATDAVNTYVRFGPGPRGAQAVLLVAKVYALLDGRMNLSFDDVREVFIESLRHRIILNFQAEADGVSSDQILSEIRNAK